MQHKQDISNRRNKMKYINPRYEGAAVYVTEINPSSGLPPMGESVFVPVVLQASRSGVAFQPFGNNMIFNEKQILNELRGEHFKIIAQGLVSALSPSGTVVFELDFGGMTLQTSA